MFDKVVRPSSCFWIILRLTKADKKGVKVSLRNRRYQLSSSSASSPFPFTMNFDFTDKTQQSFSAAIQLAKDYSNAQRMYSLVHHRIN